jgi:hypothetical protein
MSLHVHILLVCHFTCAYCWYAPSCAYTIGLLLHVHTSVCHATCTYCWYVTSRAHIIGMSLHVCILTVCHFTCTYYWYVTSCAHIIGMSLHAHVLSVCYFMCTYYRYVTSFAHTMNVVIKLCPHSSVIKFVVLYCLLSCLMGTCTLERYVNSLQMLSINVSCRSLSLEESN